MAKHILRDNSKAYDKVGHDYLTIHYDVRLLFLIIFSFQKGILAEILEPIMGKGLIPADAETWKVRRRAIVPGFHKAW